MKKNILIIGAARCGKTTLAKKLNHAYGYSVISIDDIVSGLQAYPELKITHENADQTTKNIGPFLEKYFVEISEGPHFYGGVKFAIEGTHIDFEKLMPLLQNETYKEKYEIIGVELKLEFKIGKYKFVGYADLVVRNKESGEVILVDHKQATHFMKKDGTPLKNQLENRSVWQFLQRVHRLYLKLC